MCAACGIADHIATATSAVAVAGPSTGASAPAGPSVARPTAAKFAALRHPDCRFYLFGTMLSMMADNIEHVISYWVLYQKFHSPALAGFAVISHWVPSLVLSVYFGGLADRYDCRKVIQVAQIMYMGVSAAWGYLFFTDTPGLRSPRATRSR